MTTVVMMIFFFFDKAMSVDASGTMVISFAL